MLNSQYEILEGVVESLFVYDADVNYLANADRNSQTAGIVSVLQAAVGAPGAVHSAQAASDSGDPVEAFTMHVGNQAIQGSFWKTTFKNGDNVKVIGFREDGVFIAVAVTSPVNRMIWMQPHCERGIAAQRKYLLRNSILFVLAIFILSSYLFTVPKMTLWFYLLCSSSLAVLSLILTVGMSWKDLMTFAHQMTQAGSALGIDSPEDINLVKSTSAMVKSGKPELPMGVYYY